MMYAVKFKIIGSRPLLMSSPKNMGKEQKGKKMTAKKEYVPAVEAESRAYRLNGDKSQLYITSFAFRAGMLSAASGRKIAKMTVRNAVSASVFLTDEKCPLYHPKTKKPLVDYEIDERRVVIQRQGVIRHRPMLPEWACDWDIHFDDSFMTLEILRELLELAGKIAGAGDFRPNKQGPFGQYTVEDMIV